MCQSDTYFLLQLNYDYLRQCVAAAPVTPLPQDCWRRVLQLLEPALLDSPLSAPLLAPLHAEVARLYEETIRKATREC